MALYSLRVPGTGDLRVIAGGHPFLPAVSRRKSNKVAKSATARMIRVDVEDSDLLLRNFRGFD